MTSEKVPLQHRTSRVTTKNLIDELEAGERIRVLKEGWRLGKSHHLMVNDKSRFDWIDQQLSTIAKNIEKIDEDKPEMSLRTKKGEIVSIPTSALTTASLCALVAHASRDIKNKGDLQVLNDKILQLMLNIGIKNLRQWTKKLRED